MFKKILSLSLAITLILSGCSTKEDKNESNSSVDEVKEETKKEINVDKKILDVKVNLPISLLTEGDNEFNLDKAKEDGKEKGIKDIILNEDETVTYVMTKPNYNKMMDELKAEFNKSIDDLLNNEEVKSIKEIEVSKDYSVLDIIVNKNDFENSFDGFAILGLVFQSTFYQLFDGVDAKAYKVTVNIKDIDTGEVFDTIIYPDAFGENN